MSTPPTAPLPKIEGVDYAASSDGASGTITYRTNYSAPFAFTVSAGKLDEIIQQLGMLRISLRPDVSTECPGGDWITTIDPELFVSGAPGADPTLSIRSLRFGWQHFELPKELARQVAETLAVHTDG